MAEVETPTEGVAKKSSKKAIFVGLALALVFAGGGFYLTFSGILLGSSAEVQEGHEIEALPEIAFVPVEPLVINLGEASANRHLRFGSQIEVPAAYQEEVAHLLPRIVDVMNGYLRAVDSASLEDPAALVRIRAHLLRRIQLVCGEGRVRDVLVTEFVLN